VKILDSNPKFSRFIHSVWLFPILLTLILFTLTAFKISGSSVGSYYSYFYGNQKNRDLLGGRPRGIRSDEWLVTTPLTIAQKNNNFQRINTNIGNGEDMSLILDVPYKEWSVVFKPQNLIFFVLPLDYAFAFKWWLLAYLLILSCYLFVISLDSSKKTFAILLSLTIYFSPFVQWWYQSSTLSSLFFSFFAITLLLKIFEKKKGKHTYLFSVLLAYVLTCFLLILYPPFQIPCMLAMLAFGIGVLLKARKDLPPKDYRLRLFHVVCAILAATLLTLTFLKTRINTVDLIRNTAYPGHREQQSGGFDLLHTFAGHTSPNLQFGGKSRFYAVVKNGLTNQSEASNFIYIFPFLFLPYLYLIYKRLGGFNKDPLLLSVNLCIMAFLLWLFVGHNKLMGQLTLLKMVPHQRLLIGLGLLGTIQLALFAVLYSKSRKPLISLKKSLVYALVIFIIELILGILVSKTMPGYISLLRVMLFSIPIPAAIYLLLSNKPEKALLFLLSIGIVSTLIIHPVYKDINVLENTKLSNTIKETAAKKDGAWITDEFIIENFASMNGAKTFSGVYTYPQFEIWKSLREDTPINVYNRFAHAVFSFDRVIDQSVDTTISLEGPDSIKITTEPCDSKLLGIGVRFIMTIKKLDEDEACINSVQEITYPNVSIYIYELRNNVSANH